MLIRMIKAYFKQKNYDKYIKSAEWQKLKLLVSKRDKHQCFICDSKDKLEYHHLYHPKNLYDTKMYQCITVCQKHHKKLHKKAI